MELVFATHNKHKVSEIKLLLPSSVTMVEVDEIGCTEDIPETGNTLAANALQKAKFVYDKYKRNCFAEDTGLEVKQLNGEPGVYSARYAGEECNADQNIEKLLHEMKKITDRSARFKTVIALIIDGKTSLFEGHVNGNIATQRMGSHGFGYDPIFIPEGSKYSFAQMTADEKNNVSHRAKAVQKFMEYLDTL